MTLAAFSAKLGLEVVDKFLRFKSYVMYFSGMIARKSPLASPFFWYLFWRIRQRRSKVKIIGGARAPFFLFFPLPTLLGI